MELYIHITVSLIFNFKLFLSFSSRLLGNIKPNFSWQFSTIFLSEVTNNFYASRAISGAINAYICKTILHFVSEHKSEE